MHIAGVKQTFIVTLTSPLSMIFSTSLPWARNRNPQLRESWCSPTVPPSGRDQASPRPQLTLSLMVSTLELLLQSFLCIMSCSLSLVDPISSPHNVFFFLYDAEEDSMKHQSHDGFWNSGCCQEDSLEDVEAQQQGLLGCFDNLFEREKGVPHGAEMNGSLLWRLIILTRIHSVIVCSIVLNDVFWRGS